MLSNKPCVWIERYALPSTSRPFGRTLPMPLHSDCVSVRPGRPGCPKSTPGSAWTSTHWQGGAAGRLGKAGFAMEASRGSDRRAGSRAATPFWVSRNGPSGEVVPCGWPTGGRRCIMPFRESEEAPPLAWQHSRQVELRAGAAAAAGCGGGIRWRVESSRVLISVLRSCSLPLATGCPGRRADAGRRSPCPLRLPPFRSPSRGGRSGRTFGGGAPGRDPS